jgi:hypothetical protein
MFYFVNSTNYIAGNEYEFYSYLKQTADKMKADGVI